MFIKIIKVIELFAGIGCQREALKRANIEHEVVAISENDKYASRAYELLHDKVNNLGDIKKIENYLKQIYGPTHFLVPISV